MAVINPYNYSRPKKVVINETNKIAKPRMSVKNNNNKDKQDAYFVQKVMNAKPEELTMMLYEGIIKFIKLAKSNLAKNNFEQVHENSIKAQNIVSELYSTLDKSFEFADDWCLLYEYLNDELVKGNLTKDEERFDNALEIAEELAYTWREVMRLA